MEKSTKQGNLIYLKIVYLKLGYFLWIKYPSTKRICYKTDINSDDTKQFIFSEIKKYPF